MRADALLMLLGALPTTTAACTVLNPDAADAAASGAKADAGTMLEVVIDHVSPANGPMSGGTVITITGSGFSSHDALPDKVLVGGVQTALVEVLDDTTARTETPPAETAGVVDVVIYNANGFGMATEGFSYNPAPVVAGVTPDRGDELGGETITITGTGFANLEAGSNLVLFGDSPGANVVVSDDTSLTVAAPPGEVFSVVDVAVSNANGTGAQTQAYEYTTSRSRLLAVGYGLTEPRGAAMAPSSTGAEVAATVQEAALLYQIDPGSGATAVVGGTVDGLGALAMSPDGTMYAVTTAQANPSRNLVVVDLTTGAITPIGPLPSDQNVTDLAFLGWNLFAVLANNSGEGMLGAINTTTGSVGPIGEIALDTAPRGLYGLAFDGTNLFITTGALLCVLDTATASTSACVTMPTAVSTMTFTDGELLAVSTEDSFVTSRIVRIETSTGFHTEVATLPARITALTTLD